MRVYHLISTDGGRTWPERRRIDLGAAPGSIVDRPGHRLADGVARPAVRALEGRELDPDAGSAGGVAPPVDATAERPGRRTCWSPTIPTTPSTTGTSGSRRHPDDGRLVNMFWTHDVGGGPGHRRPHRVGDARTVETWTVPVGTGPAGPALPADLARGRSAAGRLLAPGRPAGDPRRAERGLRAHLGSRPARSSCGRATRAASRAPAGRARRRSTGTTWAPGSSGIRAAPLLPDGEVLVVFYGGSGATQERALGATSGVSGRPVACCARRAGRRRARGPARDASTSWSATGRIAAIGDGLDGRPAPR